MHDATRTHAHVVYAVGTHVAVNDQTGGELRRVEGVIVSNNEEHFQGPYNVDLGPERGFVRCMRGDLVLTGAPVGEAAAALAAGDGDVVEGTHMYPMHGYTHR